MASDRRERMRWWWQSGVVRAWLECGVGFEAGRRIVRCVVSGPGSGAASRRRPAPGADPGSARTRWFVSGSGLNATSRNRWGSGPGSGHGRARWFAPGGSSGGSPGAPPGASPRPAGRRRPAPGADPGHARARSFGPGTRGQTAPRQRHQRHWLEPRLEQGSAGGGSPPRWAASGPNARGTSARGPSAPRPGAPAPGSSPSSAWVGVSRSVRGTEAGGVHARASESRPDSRASVTRRLEAGPDPHGLGQQA